MPSKQRREILQLATVSLGTALTGCVNADSGTDSSTSPPTTTDMTPTPDPEDHAPGPWHPDPAQGLASAVETRESVRDEVDYHEDREEVEIGGEFRPVEEWLPTECPYVAGRYVSGLLDDRLSNTKNVSGANLNRHLFTDKDVLEVQRVVEFDRHGELVSAPEVTNGAVREATPESVTATATLDGYEHTCEYPIYVRDAAHYLD